MFLQANFPVAGFLGDFFLFFIPWLVRFHPPTPHPPICHFAPAACCRRFPEPFRDPAFVSAVILAISHHSDSLVGFLQQKCLRRAESLQLVAPVPPSRAAHADPRLFVLLRLLHAAVRSSQHEHGISVCARGVWTASIAWGSVLCTYIQPEKGRAAIILLLLFFF